MSKELLFSVTLDDCEVQTFTAGGPGGQHQNRSQTGVRVIHHPSGARGESREERSQHANKKRAFRRMAETVEFKKWINRAIMTLDGKPTPEERVAQDMRSDNLKVEVRANGKWVEEDD